MRVIVVGLGVQGHKRRHFAGDDFVATVDPVNPEAQYRAIEEVSIKDYDAALLCIPDGPKVKLMRYLLEHKKHVLVEKPLWAETDEEIQQLETLAKKQNVVCYTAYNHRFEPHFVKMRDLIQSGVLGEIYHCRLFYGNGTARLVRESAWRDHGAGVLPDLGSHLLDTIHFWFGSLPETFSVISSHCFENRAPDHVLCVSNSNKDKPKKPQFELEMTLLSWRNHFTCDIFAEKGSAHIQSLCKWGPSTFIHRTRVFPSGHPKEEATTLVQSDPTWALEYAHFKKLCETQGSSTANSSDFSQDIRLNRMLRNLSAETLAKVKDRAFEEKGVSA